LRYECWLTFPQRQNIAREEAAQRRHEEAQRTNDGIGNALAMLSQTLLALHGASPGQQGAVVPASRHSHRQREGRARGGARDRSSSPAAEASRRRDARRRERDEVNLLSEDDEDDDDGFVGRGSDRRR